MKKLRSLVSSPFSALSHSKSRRKHQALGVTEMASSSAAPSTEDRNGRGSDLSRVSNTECSVCSNLVKDNMIINIGNLSRSATTQACEGCRFLFILSQRVHSSLRGHDLELNQDVYVNCGMLFPPKEFLVVPDANLFSQHGKIEVFKTFPRGLSCPWPTIKEATLTSGDTGSEQCHSTIAAWLKECGASHECCKYAEEPLLPARVLDIGEDLSADPLIISLIETKPDQRGKYCCLSHRWIDGDTPTTTEGNLVERKKGIKFNSLPLKYQDAINFTRIVGVRYLWIDSLCILQERSSDWLREAPRMAEYYRNAFLTISASIAVEKGQRCFSTATSASPTLVFERENGVSYAVHYRLPLSHKENPLHSRGWIFQEYMLSRRVVHFLEEEVIWECREATWCECGRVSDDFEDVHIFEPITKSAHQSLAYRRKARFQESLFGNQTTGRLKCLWMEIVHEYSQKNLTFGADIFPALAGLAKEMQSRRKCNYYAGIWEDSLVSDLLWQSEDEEWYPVGHEYPKPVAWRAPSWSWASSTACINWPCVALNPADGEFKDYNLMKDIFINNLEVECQPIGEDPTMGLKSAQLRLTGNLSVAPLALNDEKGYAVCEMSGDCVFALDHTMTTEEIVEPSLLRTLLVAKITVGERGRGSFESLVLKPTGTEAQHFERIGLLHHGERLEVVEHNVRITIV